MKKITVILTALLLLLCLSGCKKDSEPKIAVIYFSITGNTEKVAEEIVSRLNATKVELLPKVAYTDDDLSYTDMTCRSRVEQSDKLRVEYLFSLDKLEDYDYIFIGYPIWYSMAPRVIVSLLEDIRFAEKTKIIPFCTSDNTGIADSIPEIKNLQSQCIWLEGKRFGPTFNKEEADSWISSLGIIEN